MKHPENRTNDREKHADCPEIAVAQLLLPIGGGTGLIPLDSEKRYRELLERIPVVTYVALCDEIGSTCYVSPQIEHLLGFTQDEWLADPGLWHKQLHPDDRERVLAEMMNRCLGGNFGDTLLNFCSINKQTGHLRSVRYPPKLRSFHAQKLRWVSPKSPPTDQLFNVEYRILARDGRVLWVHDQAVVARDDAGQTFLQGIIHDITEQKQAMDRVCAYQEQLRRLASELSCAEERERRRIASDLHDHIGQTLAMARIKLGALREMDANLAGPLDEVRGLLDQAIRYTRSLTFELSPPVLHDLGLVAALEWLGEQFEHRHGLGFELVADEQPEQLEEETRVFLFRAVRELLLNVVKHAGASRVRIAVRREDDSSIRIEVEDNGTGFDVAQTDSCCFDGCPGGFGLFSIRERLSSLGGSLCVVSATGHGTRVALLVPTAYAALAGETTENEGD